MVSPDNPRISIVIRCYNEAAHIGKLFEEIKKQSLGDYEVLVVDSGSDDRTLEIVAGEDARVLHIEKEKFSFGRSLNIGCAEARGDLLVFISAHCYPEHEEWLAHLVDAFDHSWTFWTPYAGAMLTPEQVSAHRARRGRSRAGCGGGPAGGGA